MSALLSSVAPTRRRVSLGALVVDSLSELRRRQPHLATAALLSMLVIVPCLFAFLLDTRTINGINVWIKPIKFLVSFTVYYATLAWVFGYLPRKAQASRAGRFVIWAALLAGLYEMAWLILAGAHGVPAHFNYASRVWSTAYGLAGAGAVTLIVAILVQGVMIARQREIPLSPALRWSLVAGALIAFAATLVTAGFLSTGTSHWIGDTANDAAGLPLMGWSRASGDLRVAHFWALHAQQAIPLAGVLLVAARLPRARGAVVLVSLAYLGLIVFTFAQALNGQPFLPFLR